jgi:HK97 family phage prohead protease
MEKFTKEAATKIKQWFESADVKAAIEATEKAVEGDTGTFEVVISTENLDRYQEVISINGWDLEHYRNNPVVLWGHDHFTLPIGVATFVGIEEGKLIARGKFAPHAFAQEIRTLYDAGIVRATSVGFIEKEREGNLITRAELLEFSFVSVPANPYALALAIEKELSVNELVTKGIFTLKEVETEPETPEEELTVTEVETEPTEKQFSSKAIAPVVEHLRAALVALEALDTEEPERNDDEPEVEETEDERQLREFNEARKILQDASTVVGDVLAQARRAIQVRR